MPACSRAAILSVGRAAAAGDDRAGVAHALARRGGLAGDERGHRLLDVLRDELRRLLLGGAADLADHEDRLGLRDRPGSSSQQVDEASADDRVAADADAGGLAQPEVASAARRPRR